MTELESVELAKLAFHAQSRMHDASEGRLTSTAGGVVQNNCPSPDRARSRGESDVQLIYMIIPIDYEPI